MIEGSSYRTQLSANAGGVHAFMGPGCAVGHTTFGVNLYIVFPEVIKLTSSVAG